MSRRAFRRATLALALLSGAATAEGATKQIDKFEKWSAHLLTEKKARICFVHGEPTKKLGQYKKRGDVFVQIAHHPRENVVNEVGFTAGYAYKKDSDAVVDIDGKKFTLFTHKDGAWAPDAKADNVLVQAMMKGRRMIIRGTSSRGTKTVDTNSLIGFTRPHHPMNPAAGRLPAACLVVSSRTRSR